MARQVKKSKEEIATIDCTLVTIETEDGEFGFDTANQIQVEPQVEEEDAVKLVVKGILRAQKPKQTTITGNQITLTDNVFNPDLVLVLQGGQIMYAQDDPTKIIGYEPPVAGSPDKGEIFKLNAYTAQYDASGQIVKYEKISYPNCQGQPVAFNSEDGAFRAPEYVIDSAPKQGEAPYSLSYVDELPKLVDDYELEELQVTSAPGTSPGQTKLTVVGTEANEMLYYKRFENESDAQIEVNTLSYGQSIGTADGYLTMPPKNLDETYSVVLPSNTYVVVVAGKAENGNVKVRAAGFALVNAL